jgi:hypothetical protein
MKEERCWAVRDSVGVHSLQKAEIVDMSGDMGKQFTDRLTTLAVLLKLPRRLEDAVFLDLPGFRQNSGIVEFKQLAIVSCQARFVVEGVHVAGTTLHEQKDHAFGARRMVGCLGLQGICHRSVRIALSHAHRGQVAESAGD